MSTSTNEQNEQKGNLTKDEKDVDDILKQTLNDSTTDSTTDSTQQAPSDQTHPGAPGEHATKVELSGDEQHAGTNTVSDNQITSNAELAPTTIEKDGEGPIQDSSSAEVKIETSIGAGGEGATETAETSLDIATLAATTTATPAATNPSDSVSENLTDSSHAQAQKIPNNLHKTQEDFDKKYPADVYLQPASDEPIETPTANDILFGRGGLTNHHPGNKKYRQIIAAHKRDYIQAAKIIKPRVARRIVHTLRKTVGARFLKKNPEDNLWRDVGDKAASEKTSQALREKSPEEKKASSSKKNKPANSVAAGYTMPGLSANGTFAIQSAVNSYMDTPMAKMEKRDGDLSVGEGFDDSAHAAIYPVEGGIFGAVNAEGDVVVTEQDILLGRGGATNHHKGNKRFRDIVALHRPDYLAAPKIRKPDVSRKIVKGIRNASPPGRFLKKGDDGKWFDVGDKKAAEKASQALREKGPEARKARANANAQMNRPYRPCEITGSNAASGSTECADLNLPTQQYNGGQTNATDQEMDSERASESVGEGREENLKRKPDMDHDEEEESKKIRPAEDVVDI